MKEMKALKKLARDMSTEKEALVQKTERNAAIISHMINEALAKDDELGCLRTSIETLQTGRPDAFVMNGACVPGLPVTLLNSKKEADDDSFANTENPDKVVLQAKRDAVDGAIGVSDTFGPAHLDDCKGKLKVEEEKEMLIVNKAIEDQKQHFGEGVRVEELELKVSPKLRNKKRRNFLMNCFRPKVHETHDS